MLLTVMPSDELFVCACEGKEVVTILGLFLSPLYLGIQPAAADDRVGLKELQRTLGTHLTADYADKIVLHGQLVDAHNLFFVHDDAQDTFERLRLTPLPMKVNAYYDVFQCEAGVRCLRTECQ